MRRSRAPMARSTKPARVPQASSAGQDGRGGLAHPALGQDIERGRCAPRSGRSRAVAAARPARTRRVAARAIPTTRITSMASRLGPKAASRSSNPESVFRITSPRTSFHMVASLSNRGIREAPALAQVGLLLQELVGQASDVGLHRLCVALSPCASRRRRCGPGRGAPASGGAALRGAPAVVGHGEVEDHANPQRVGEHEGRVLAARPGPGSVPGSPAGRTSAHTSRRSRAAWRKMPSIRSTFTSHRLQPHPVREAEERHLPRLGDLRPAGRVGLHQVEDRRRPPAPAWPGGRPRGPWRRGAWRPGTTGRPRSRRRGRWWSSRCRCRSGPRWTPRRAWRR